MFFVPSSRFDVLVSKLGPVWCLKTLSPPSWPSLYDHLLEDGRLTWPPQPLHECFVTLAQSWCPPVSQISGRHTQKQFCSTKGRRELWQRNQFDRLGKSIHDDHDYSITLRFGQVNGKINGNKQDGVMVRFDRVLKNLQIDCRPCRSLNLVNNEE